MAKTSAIQKNKRREKMVKRYENRRKKLKSIISDLNQDTEIRFSAVLKLASLPRNGSKVRIRNRCEISGRSRAVYRKFKLSRIALRDLASVGLIPGLVKASW
jgi:small subunit ribosomal protein S14